MSTSNDIVAYKGASLELVYDYKNEAGAAYDISNFEATLNLYKLGSQEVHTTRTMSEPSISRRTEFFTVAEVEALPENMKYEILFTKKDETSRVYVIHTGSFTVSDVQRTGTIQATATTTLGDTVENVVTVSFGTMPLKGDKGDKGDAGEPLNPTAYDVKASVVDADKLTAFDSAASNNPVTIAWSVIKSAFASYYNSLTATLTGKTIDADNNTISNLAHGSEVDNPSSGVHGVTGSVVGTSDTQTLTNKTLGDNLNADSNKIVNLATPTGDTDSATKKYVDDETLNNEKLIWIGI